MFEDLTRTVAAYRSAVDFADSRRERELERTLQDPRARTGPAAEAAREAAHARHAGLVGQARAVLDRDLAQLRAESEVVEPALPPAPARWDNPVWHAYQPPADRPTALWLGDLTLPEAPDLRIPMLLRLPLERGLWGDSGPARAEDGCVVPGGLREPATRTAVALAARLLAVHPVGALTVHVIDPDRSVGESSAPLAKSGVLHEPPAAGARGVDAVLDRLVRRVELVRTAVRHHAVDALPDDMDLADQLLWVHDFPHGFDDRALTKLRYLVDEGVSAGVTLMLVADRRDADEYGPVLDPLWRSLLRLTPVPDDHLADPWVGHAWRYEPPLPPPGSGIVPEVLRRLAAARRERGG